MSAGTWWDARYKYRRKLTVSAGSSAVPSTFLAKGTFNLGSLTEKLANRNDVRIVRWNGGTSWTEKNRYIYSDTAWYFAIDNAISSGSSDSNYYLYYGYSGAGSPPADRTKIFVPRKDSNTLSLYYFDSTLNDYAGGQLTPDCDLSSAGCSYSSDAPFYKSIYADGGDEHYLYRNDWSQDAGYWGSSTYPLRTIEFWGKLPQTGNGRQLMNYWRSGASGEWNKFFVEYHDNTMQVWWIHTDNNVYNASSDSSYILHSGWHHYAIVWTGSQMKFYRDGSLYQTVSASYYPKGTNSNNRATIFALFDGSSMTNETQGYLYGLRFSKAVESSFPHGARSSLPTVSVGSEENVFSVLGLGGVI